MSKRQLRFNICKLKLRASLVPQLVKNLPAMQETLVLFLGWEVPLEKEMKLQYSCLKNPMDTRAWWGTVQIQCTGSGSYGA